MVLSPCRNTETLHGGVASKAMVAIETYYFLTQIVRDGVRIFRCCLFSLRRDLQIRFCVFLQWNHWFHQLFSETASNLVGHIDVRTRSTGPPRTWHPGCLVPCTSRRRTASSTRLLTVQKVAPMTWLFSPALRFLWEIAGLLWCCVAFSVSHNFSFCSAKKIISAGLEPISGQVLCNFLLKTMSCGFHFQITH